jgi:cystathionine beta-lyase/cystathionine gamma-synthase
MAAGLDVLMPIGGTVYVTTETYRKTIAYLTRQSKRLDLHIQRFDNASHLDGMLSANSHPTLIVLESPTNPHMRLHDFDEILRLKKKHGCSVLADISLAGLCNVQFDFSQYDCTTLSCTKYVSGHNDLMGGVLLAGNSVVFEDLWSLRSERGGIMDPFSAYLLLRSLRTYDMRIARQVANATAVIKHLDGKDHVSALCHPSRGQGEQAIIYEKYYRHGGSMISFVIDMDVDRVLSRLAQMHSVKMAPSFGAIDTLIEVPSVMSHYGTTPEQLRAMGLEPNLVRLSVGCEPVDDLVNDLDNLFEKK